MILYNTEACDWSSLFVKNIELNLTLEIVRKKKLMGVSKAFLRDCMVIWSSDKKLDQSPSAGHYFAS